MAEYLIQGETLTAIADAIRAKGGTSSALTPADMAEAIEEISAGGAKVISFTPTTISKTVTIPYSLSTKPVTVFIRAKEFTFNETTPCLLWAVYTNNIPREEGFAFMYTQEPTSSMTQGPGFVMAGAARIDENAKTITVDGYDASIQTYLTPHFYPQEYTVVLM